MSSEQRAAARRLAAETLTELLQGGLEATDAAPGGPRETSPEMLRELMSFTLGEDVSDRYLGLLLEELADGGQDLRAPEWHKDALDASRAFRVVIIGAGMSGLVAAHRLQQAGIDTVVLEKNRDVGGTWFENHYPGCRVDVPNQLYSYSFAQREDWPAQFSPQSVLLDYFRDCADELGIRDHIRFETEVIAAEFDDEQAVWSVTLRGADGEIETLTANVVVSAVGQLNRPSLPPIAGREEFEGPSWHSAEWDHSVPLAGKRVAVIGTGASGIQLIPAIAEEVGELLVFQRTPNWLTPTPQYYDALSDEAQWLFRELPTYGRWYRFWLFWQLAEGMLPAARVDPEWVSDGGSVNAVSEALRAMLTAYLEGQFADRPDLQASVVPEYPPLAKRMLLDNGIWARTLKRENVQLVTADIERITRNGIVVDGKEREVDVIVYATGFQASGFLMPMRVTGRGGIDLHDQWDGTARAYLGLTVPGFPNLFCLYGPNTNLVANGSIIFFSECEVRFVLAAIKVLLDQDRRALDCKRESYDVYNEQIDAGNAAMAWGVSTANSWYKNKEGKVTQNWPFSLLEFWERTRSPDLADFELL